jgi:hypothetical protein
MQTINFTVPQGWHELTDKQLRYVYRLLADNYEIDELKTLCFLRWTGTKVIGKQPSEKYMLRHDDSYFEVSPVDFAALLQSLNWLAVLPTVPIRIASIARHHALAADFQGVAFEKFLVCENLYQGFLQTKSDDLLDQLASILYPKSSNLLPITFNLRLSDAERINVFYWFAALKEFFASRFPEFLQPLSSCSDNLLGAAPNIGAQLQEAMDAQIRALTKGDVTKEQEILALDTWRALTELNAQAKDYQELKRSFAVRSS